MLGRKQVKNLAISESGRSEIILKNKKWLTMRILAKRAPGICVRPTSRGGPDINSRGLEKYALLLPRRTKVLSMSFSLLVVPWTENFRYKVTFLGLLNF
jgi:hypothetical protein